MLSRPSCARFAAVLLALLLGALPAVAQSDEPLREVRGVYLTNVDSNVLSSRENIAGAMDYLADNGFNVVFPVVWNKGYTLHPSDVMADLFGEAYRQDRFFAGQERDPLQEVIVEAHRRGMEVIPWFEYGFASAFGSPGHILQAYPEWAGRGTDGEVLSKNGFFWMNGLHPDVQAFLTSLMLEVIERYDVDGVKGDDRLPAMPSEGGYSTFTVDLYRSEHGGQDPPSNPRTSAFVQWKADKLTAYLGDLYRTVKERGAHYTLALAPSHYPWSLQEYLQDNDAWLDSGYVDLISPQLYRYSIGEYRSVSDQTRAYVEPFQRDRLAPAILVKAGGRYNGWDYVRQAVEYNRRFGIDGETYFFYEGLGAQNEYVADSLGATFYAEPAILPTRTSLWRPLPRIASETAAQQAGTWTASIGTPGYEGTMLKATPASAATLTYDLTAPYDASYDLFAYTPADKSDATAAAQYTVTTPTGTTTATVDQRGDGGWRLVGPVTLQEGQTLTVTLDAGAAGDGQNTYADALMLLLNRARTPDLVIPTTTESAPGEQPTAVRLHGAYPNPFNPATTLRFTLPAATTASLTVYDALGRHVATLFADRTFAPGTHTAPADLSGLPSGLYVARLTTPAATATQPLVLVK